MFKLKTYFSYNFKLKMLILFKFSYYHIKKKDLHLKILKFKWKFFKDISWIFYSDKNLTLFEKFKNVNKLF